jgi:hypothetical protein
MPEHADNQNRRFPRLEEVKGKNSPWSKGSRGNKDSFTESYATEQRGTRKRVSGNTSAWKFSRLRLGHVVKDNAYGTYRRLEEERKRRFLHSIPEAIRIIVSDYLSTLERVRNEK